jgi:transposase
MEKTVVATEKTGTAWVGMDVAKDTFDAGIWLALEPDGERAMKKIPVKTFARTVEGVTEALDWIDGVVLADAGAEENVPAVRAVMEATGSYSLELTLWMIALRPSLEPAIINPKTARSYAESLSVRNKSDRMDARVLARYGAERRPSPYEPPTPERAELRAVARYRVVVVCMRAAEESRAKEPNASALAQRMIHKHIAQFKKDEAALERQLRKIVETMPDVERDAQALDGIFGVGFLTAVTVLAELGDLRRFETGRQLTATSGLSPMNKDSGKIHKRPRLCKIGNPHVRKALYMPAMAAVRGDNDFADLYNRLIAQGKKTKVAYAAVMRKILLVMRAILRSGQPYQKHYRRPVENLGKTCGENSG